MVDYLVARRVTLVVAFAFLPQNFWNILELEPYLLYLNHLNFLHSEVVATLTLLTVSFRRSLRLVSPHAQTSHSVKFSQPNNNYCYLVDFRLARR